MKLFKELKEKRRLKKLQKYREKCAKCMKKCGYFDGEKCPGKMSKNRDFCFVEEACFDCKYWS